jgi:5-formyltetrahydrofolate cyclo-ligase
VLGRNSLGETIEVDEETIDTALLKIDLRSRLLSARVARSPASRDAARTAIAAHVLARLADSAPRWSCVAAYLPMRTEPGSRQLLAGLASAGVRVLVPILLDDRDLDWAEWTESGPGPALGIAAIAGASAVLVPALAVDSAGMRLGRGGGSYDRALGRITPGTPVAALLYEEELLDNVPSESWDQPVTATVTPSGWHDIVH